MAGPVNRMFGATTRLKQQEHVTGAASPQIDSTTEAGPGRTGEVMEQASNIVDSAMHFLKRHPVAILCAGLGLAALFMLTTSHGQRPGGMRER
jgi:hypothetical protein